jgi:hypothetical protein
MTSHLHFCTYFDRRYLTRALALHASLTAHCRSFTLWALCLDADTLRILSALSLPSLEPIALADLEGDDLQLRAAKASRSLVEYYFTCTPAFPLHLLRKQREIDLITYLDSDLWFFADPQLVLSEMGARSVAIIPHRFPSRLSHLEKHGVYNVGWVTFRRDQTGLDCLEYWRSRCLAWCPDTVSGDAFADQKYLDEWPVLFGNVAVIAHKGANLAPWNVVNYRIGVQSGAVHIDAEPLIFFHFHGLRRIDRWLYESGLGNYGATLSARVRRLIYQPYLRQLRSIGAQLKPFGIADHLPGGIRPNQGAWPTRRSILQSLLGRVSPWKSSRIFLAGQLAF